MSAQQSPPTGQTLVWAVVALTLGVAAAVVALAIFLPGESTAAITAILGIATPAVGVLIVILQNQRTKETVEEVRHETQVTAERVDIAAHRAEETTRQTARTAQAASATAAKVEEIKEMVNGRQLELQRRVAELEQEVKTARRPGPAAVVVADAEGMIRSVSPALTALLRWDAADLVGQSIETLIPGRYLEAHRKKLARLLETGAVTWRERNLDGHALIKGDGELPVTVLLKAWQDRAETWVITAEIRRRA